MARNHEDNDNEKPYAPKRENWELTSSSSLKIAPSLSDSQCVYHGGGREGEEGDWGLLIS